MAENNIIYKEYQYSVEGKLYFKYKITAMFHGSCLVVHSIWYSATGGEKRHKNRSESNALNVDYISLHMCEQNYKVTPIKTTLKVK